ncbi:signal peptide peptidase SppA [Calidifontibacillus erzurumensis]|uniref:Signal peptide peptidase SppA n=1 Tax=Calidifontibacillus erzurumensis TaxID=2741433 RepID=A0A8J8GCS0_9BACI|nr:signal peptide peptidase SppA [Calidifontibacillus erzurumensis]NSL51302.1 signal peptide peptidase SppA [Calidifontibacillus erzurumensis]
MNSKRWMALGLATLLFFFSLGVNVLSSLAFEEIDEWQVSFFNDFDEEFTETVLEAGSEQGRIVVLEINGVIQDTGEVESFISTPGYRHKTFMRMLDRAQKDANVKGIIIRVNSPGGGVLESAEIYDKLIDIKEKQRKPIYVSMGSLAASGGYYISTAADKIFASPETLTGSLGVIIQSINYAELAKRYGVKFETIKSGPYKDILSPTREMTEEERKILQEMVNHSYEEFVNVIATGRKMPVEKVRKIADGRIYDGRQAKDLGLIDEFGYLEDAIREMKKLKGIGDVSVIEYEPSFSLNSLFKMASYKLFSNDFEIIGLAKLLNQPNAPRLMYLYTR